MKPVLFDSGASSFTTQGIGVLSDAISCEVTEERNGAYELTMEYPLDGERFSEIGMRSIIVAKPNPTDDPQPFRVYEIIGNLSGTATINAEHISYDMSGIPVQPFSASNLATTLTAMKTNAVVDCPFTLTTDKTVATAYSHTVPSSMRSMLGGTEGSLLDVYGGEWQYDTYTAKLCLHRGSDNGVVIKYGKNLTDLEQEKNCADSYTGVYPYWVSQDGETVVQLTERIIYAVTNDSYALTTESSSNIVTEDEDDIMLEDAPVDQHRILMLNFSQDSEEAATAGEEDAPTESELRSRAQAYIANNDIFSPKVSIKVSFEQLADTEDYKDIAVLEQVSLCDTVTVVFEKLGVSTTAKVVTVTYDALKERYVSVEIGSARTNIADTIASIQSDVSTASDDAYSSLNAAGGNISGDLYVGGTFRQDGTFVSNATEVSLSNPMVWQDALGTYGVIYQLDVGNGLTVDYVKRFNGAVVTIYGTGTDTTTMGLYLPDEVPFTVYGWLCGASAADCGYFSINEYGYISVTLTTTGEYAFAQVYIPGEY